MHLVSRTTPTSVAPVLTMPPKNDWDGLLVSTVCSAFDARLAVRMFDCWQPWISILAFPSQFSHWEVVELLPALHSRYEKKTVRCCHIQVSGVTTTSWYFVHMSRLSTQASCPMPMTMNVHPHCLQTGLDDTLGGHLCKQVNSFEPREDLRVSVMGRLLDATFKEMVHVYSATKVGPNISEMKFEGRLFWVEAATVMSKDPAIRRVVAEELHAMWDYEGKLKAE